MGLPVLSAREIAFGYPTGSSTPAQAGPVGLEPDPARALQRALLPALRRPPCVVAFSGGRDSSLLLAVAADVAAREGLDPPHAVTFRYPGDPVADESEWQELVVGHLRRRGLRFEWSRHDVDGELDLLGPLTTPVLRGHGGPVFPPAIGNTIALARYAPAGSLVTGNAGDEVLGGHRSAVLRAVLRRRGRRLSRADWAVVARAAAPAPVRRLLVRRVDHDAAWLRPALRREALAEAARGDARRPLRWDRSVRAALASRAVEIGERTRAHVAAEYDCVLVDPLRSSAFVASYAAFGGRWGGMTRSAGTRLLAGGLLPEELVRRSGKAYFNGSRFGPVSREFARGWDGAGVDEHLVDPVALRAAWLAEVPPGSTAMLLQQAWLAART